MDGELVIQTDNPRLLTKKILNFLGWEELIINEDGDNAVFAYPSPESKVPMIHFIYGNDYLVIISDELYISKIKGMM